MELLGSGLGSLSSQAILQSLSTMFAAEAKVRFAIDIDPVPLSEVEEAWTRKETNAESCLYLRSEFSWAFQIIPPEMVRRRKPGHDSPSIPPAVPEGCASHRLSFSRSMMEWKSYRGVQPSSLRARSFTYTRSILGNIFHCRRSYSAS